MSVVEGLVDVQVAGVEVVDDVVAVDEVFVSVKLGSVEVGSRMDVEDVESFPLSVP